MLRASGISVAVFDTMLNDPEKGFEAALAEHRPALVVVYEDNFNFLTKMCLTRMREVAFQMAINVVKYAKQPTPIEPSFCRRADRLDGWRCGSRLKPGGKGNQLSVSNVQGGLLPSRDCTSRK